MDELWEMVWESADVAFTGALELRDDTLVKAAGENVLKSEGYNKEIKHRAAAFFNSLSMQ